MSKKFYELQSYKSLPCATALFTIKGKDACLSDFGDWNDGVDVTILWETPDGGCPHRTFKARSYEENPEVAEKYNLTKEEYDTLAGVLEEKFFIGRCECCV